MARPLALGARHRGGSSPLYPTLHRDITQRLECNSDTIEAGGSNPPISTKIMFL